MFNDYLQCTRFKLLNENNQLLYILRKLDIDTVSQRCAAESSKYDFGIIYRSGMSNTAVDSLSRLTIPTTDNEALFSWCNEKSHTVSAILCYIKYKDVKKLYHCEVAVFVVHCT